MLKVLKPTVITESMLLHSSIPENDHPAWSVSSSYAAGDRVIVLADHSVYQAAVDIAADAGNQVPVSDTARWVQVCPTNRWSMFDSNVNTRSVGGDSGLLVRLQPGACNGLALLDMVGVGGALTITCSYASPGLEDADQTSDYAYGITMRTLINQGVTRLIYTVSLESRNVSNWKSYFVEPYEIKSDAFIGFSTRSDMEIEVSIPSASAQIGSLIVGNFVEIGNVLLGANSEIEDYSSIQTDEFGVSRLVERQYVKRVSYPLSVPNWAVRRAFSTLAAVQSKATVFVGSSDYQLTPLTVFGRCSRFTMSLELPTESMFQVEVTGITL